MALHMDSKGLADYSQILLENVGIIEESIASIDTEITNLVSNGWKEANSETFKSKIQLLKSQAEIMNSSISGYASFISETVLPAYQSAVAEALKMMGGGK